MFTRSAEVSAVPPVPQSEFASQVKPYAISLVVLKAAIAVAPAAAAAAFCVALAVAGLIELFA